jgi:hypothetical protein
MGKSTILEKLIQDSKADEFFIKIVLNDFTKELSKIKSGKIILQNIDVMDFILESFSKTDDFEISIIKNMAQEKRLILMFDGVDEVIDYKEQVKVLIKTLKEKYKLKKIVITTRNNLKEDLENYFETISFDLNNFNREDQISFLVKYWRKLHKNLNESFLNKSAEEIITKIESSLSLNISQLIGIPLQTKMIADIFSTKLSQESDLSNIKINNIADLYHEFVEEKFNIQFEQKNKFEISRVVDFYEKEKEEFYNYHFKLSSVFLFEKNNFETNLRINETDEKRIVKFGLILSFNNRCPIFVHKSFAEYFEAVNSFFKMQLNLDFDSKLRQILKNNHNFLIRTFLDNLIQSSKNEIIIARTNVCDEFKICISLNYNEIKKARLSFRFFFVIIIFFS